MNALDFSLAQALKSARSKPIAPISVSQGPAPAILKVNSKLFGPSRDTRGRFIKTN